jgi:hypothetical protein
MEFIAQTTSVRICFFWRGTDWPIVISLLDTNNRLKASYWTFNNTFETGGVKRCRFTIATVLCFSGFPEVVPRVTGPSLIDVINERYGPLAG